MENELQTDNANPLKDEYKETSTTPYNNTIDILPKKEAEK